MLKFGSRYCNGNRGLNNLLVPASFRLLCLYSSIANEGNPCSSLTAFLVNSLGFTKQLSLSISAKLAKYWQAGGDKKVSDFNFVDNAHSVVHFFEQLGFQQSHIRKIVSIEPRILVSRVDKTLEPKIKLLNDVGICGSDLLQVILKNPSLFSRNLSPTIHAFRRVLGTDGNLVRVLKRSHYFNFNGAANYLITNVEILQTYCGFLIDNIQKHILMHPNTYCMRTDLFRDSLIRVEQKLGIPRNEAMFLYGVQMISCLSEKNIDDKCEIFKSYGWTQSDVMELIRRNPMCLTSAEARIKERLDFLMNQLGYNSAYLASQPALFTYSIQKRLLPRHSVLQILKEKGLLRKNYSMATAVSTKESYFLKKFVLPFEQVHQVYAQLTGSTIELRE